MAGSCHLSDTSSADRYLAYSGSSEVRRSEIDSQVSCLRNGEASHDVDRGAATRIRAAIEATLSEQGSYPSYDEGLVMADVRFRTAIHELVREQPELAAEFDVLFPPMSLAPGVVVSLVVSHRRVQRAPRTLGCTWPECPGGFMA